MTSPPVDAIDRRRAALAYPLGLVTGIYCLLTRGDQPFVRFHAWQSIVGTVLVIAAVVALETIPIIGGLLQLALVALSLTIGLVMMARAFRGAWSMIPVVGDIARDLSRIDA